MNIEELLPHLSLVGEKNGRVKDLNGYRKPTLGSPGSSLAGLGSEEVGKAGEELFAALRPALNYKRKDIAFSQEGGTAVLAAKDFDLTIEIVPHPDDESLYLLRRTLSRFNSPSFFEHPEFNRVFTGSIQRLELKSTTPVKVEDWIDRVEDRDLEEEWQLQYPPDYSHCTLRLPRSEFEIKVTSHALIMTRLLPGNPREFWEGLQKLSPVLEGN
jgi:hypothetical protein